ncbi:MAG: hypothetical protein ACLVJN_09565 [Streptococcus parasanguinis]
MKVNVGTYSKDMRYEIVIERWSDLNQVGDLAAALLWEAQKVAIITDNRVAKLLCKSIVVE